MFARRLQGAARSSAPSSPLWPRAIVGLTKVLIKAPTPRIQHDAPVFCWRMIGQQAWVNIADPIKWTSTTLRKSTSPIFSEKRLVPAGCAALFTTMSTRPQGVHDLCDHILDAGFVPTTSQPLGHRSAGPRRGFPCATASGQPRACPLPIGCHTQIVTMTTLHHPLPNQRMLRPRTGARRR